MENISRTRQTSHRNGQIARRRGNFQSSTPVITSGSFANGFLTTQFLPLYQPPIELIEYNDAIERDFYKSCSELAKANDIDLIDVKDKPYPYNILLSYWDIFKQLERTELSLSVDIMELDDRSISIIASQTYDISYIVYHIPVLPLYNYLKDDNTKKSVSSLLLSIYAYLFHCASIPYYRDRETSMNFLYEVFRDYILQDRDSFTEEEYINEMQVFKDAKRIGDIVGKKIYNLKHLEELASRITGFIPMNQTEKKLLKLAKTALHLLNEYPNNHIMKNMKHEEAEDDDYDEGWVAACSIFSFVYSNDNDLSDLIVSNISEDFGNTGNSDRPCITRAYHKKNEEPMGLGYELILIQLIDDLLDFLNDLK